MIVYDNLLYTKIFYLTKQVLKGGKYGNFFVNLFNFSWDDAGFALRAFDNILNVEFAIRINGCQKTLYRFSGTFYNITIILFEFSFKLQAWLNIRVNIKLT